MGKCFMSIDFGNVECESFSGQMHGLVANFETACAVCVKQSQEYLHSEQSNFSQIDFAL